MVDAQGLIGWAPASFLVPLNEDDEQEVDSGENLMENQNERGNSILDNRSSQYKGESCWVK